MQLSRRQFFTLAGSSAAGTILLPSLYHFYAKRAIASKIYGPLQPDPEGVLDLPAGFKYRRLSEAGQEMDDGYRVPRRHDGMAAFAGANNTTILIRNHELAFDAATQVEAPEQKKYDPEAKGGTTTLIVNRDRQLVKHYGSLAGTDFNCAGGQTPWGSWLSCEESVEIRDRRHGYVFEVPSSTTGFVKPLPLKAMGRFRHEAAAVEPRSGDIYMTEDREDGLFYRFVPNQRGNLSAGGTLYALKLADQPQAITKAGFPVNQRQRVEWIRIDTPDPETDSVRAEGYAKGAAQFSRGEGMIAGQGEIYFSCTNGGSAGAGQIWRYNPAESSLELYLEPNNAKILDYPDNLVISPQGRLFVCEDGAASNYIVAVNPSGEPQKFARNALNNEEFAGVCFSPDGQTMFVNLQKPGITLAIWGPW
jgi:uncharacterized protein